MTVADVLRRIVEQRRSRLGSIDEIPRPVERPVRRLENPFLHALAARRGEAVIAEIKMGSPSLGRLDERVDPERRARAYRDGGAAALSVVVEPDFFYGSYDLLRRCREASGLPAVAKDFIVHPAQIEQAMTAGADAVLLIAALYEREDLRKWADLARSWGLVPLVETHGAGDAAKLDGRDWELVGVNNRDLRTFEVDLGQSIEQAKRLPVGALKVAESGIRDRQDVETLTDSGFEAFLVGETLLLAEDAEAKVRELVGGGPEVLGS